MSSVVGYGPLWRIDGPPPLPPLYGLLQAAMQPAAGVRIVPDLDDGIERWMNGVEVYPYPPDLADVYDPCAPGSDATEKGFGEELAHPQFGAMTIWIAETCTSSRVWSQEQFKARAVAVFSAVEGAGVAKELLGGGRMPLNPYLANGDGEFPNADTSTSIQYGIALLEAEIARTGRQGLIHCSPQVLAMGARNYFGLDNKTGVIRTINGTVVIPDAGYVDGATPEGHADPSATEEWMYATGPIDLRRSETFVQPETVEAALDRGMAATNGKPNSITYRVERYYLADWDTELQAAVLVDRCSTDCGAGS